MPIVPDPPLARSLHASVEVGQQIPEELFQAVAQILAYVYRVAGRRRLGRLEDPCMTDMLQQARQVHRPDRRRRSSCWSW